MIKERANIVAINKGEVIVTSQIKSTCSSCSQVSTCGSGQVAKALPKPQLTLTLPYDEKKQKLAVGDCVIIALPEQYVLSSAAQTYMLPIFGLISFSAIGQWLFNQGVFPHELFALSLGGLGGYLGYRIAKYQQKQSKQSKKLQPQIIEIIPSLELSE